MLISVVHILGALLLFAGLGGLCLAPTGADNGGQRKLGSMAHGIGLVVLLLSGVAMLAGSSVQGLPAWAWGKILIWLALGGVVVVLKRAPGLRVPMLFLLPLLGAVAAWLGLARPGG